MGIHKVVTKNGVRTVERQATPEEIRKSRNLDLSPEQEIEAALEAEDNDGPPVIPGEDHASPGVAAGLQCPACDFSAGSMAAFQEHMADAHPVADEGGAEPESDEEPEGEGGEDTGREDPGSDEESGTGEDPVLRNQDGEEIGEDEEVPGPKPVEDEAPATEEEEAETESDPIEELDFDLDSDL